MPANPVLQKLLDAGAQFTETTQANAERLVAELQKAGGVRRKEAEKAVEQLVERGRRSSEQLVSTVQSEVTKQLKLFAERIEGLESQLQQLASKVGLPTPPVRRGRRAAAKPAAPAAQAAPATKNAAAAAKKAAPAKKASAAKKAAPAKQAPAKKASAAKRAAPAKQAAGASGVAKVAAKKSAKS